MKKSEVRKAGDLPNWIVEFHKKLFQFVLLHVIQSVPKMQTKQSQSKKPLKIIMPRYAILYSTYIHAEKYVCTIST